MPDNDKDNKDVDDRISAAVQSLIKKHSGADEALTLVIKENYDYRERHRQDQEKISSLSKKIPTEGSVVLTGDDAKTYQKMLGEDTIADLKRRLDAGAQAIDETARYKRKDEVRTVAAVMGWNDNVLNRLVTNDMTFEVSEKDGEKSAVITVDDKVLPLEQYANDNWVDFLPALGSDGKQDTNSAATSQPALPHQFKTATKRPGQGKVLEVDDVIKRKTLGEIRSYSNF